MSRRTALLGSVILFLSLLVLPTQAVGAACAAARHIGGEWRSYGHDQLNSRSQPAEKTIGPTEAALLTPEWTFSAQAAGGDGDFTGTPTIADGCLYVASNAGWVFAAQADTGQKIWATKLKSGGGVNSSVTVQDGQVYVSVARVGSPYVAALDQRTGRVLWATTLDTQPGSDVYASPVLVDGVLLMGVSGGSAELGDETDRYAFQGSLSLIETGTSVRSTKRPGQVLRKTWTIAPPSTGPPKGNFAGATIWSSPAVDPVAKVAYVGAGNPFRPQAEHKHANAVLKFDVDRRSRTFGEVVASYKGDIDEYLPVLSTLPCADVPGNPAPYYPQGIGQCGDIDLDFGASPNLFALADGRRVVGVGQKSGVYHVMDARTMKPIWKQLVGVPTSVGGIVGSTAAAGGAIYGPITTGGYLWSLDQVTGKLRWVAPVGDGVHWGNPVSIANGVVYTVDFRGFLDGYDALNGVQVLHRPLNLGGPLEPALSWGGVSIARGRVYAAIGMSGLPNGHVVALRPMKGLPTLPLAPAPVPSAGPEEQANPRIVSGPQAQFAGYATRVIVASKSTGRLQYTNLDVVRHDVVQNPRTDGVAGPGTDRWCNRFRGPCPVFWTPLLGLGETTEVLGLKNTKAGRTYSFYCTLHPGMQGTLAVVG